MTVSSTLSSQSPLRIDIWGATDVGRTREGNEDSIFPDSSGQGFYRPQADSLDRKGHLLIVADGVGGAQGGREASQWAIQRAVERYYDLPGSDLGNDLHTAVTYANSSLMDHLQHQQMTEAGCTMTAAVIHGTTLYVANVGDSRTYLIRNGRSYQLTKDHTLTQQKVDQGKIRPEDVALDPDKSVLTRSMGAVPNVKVDLFRQPLQPGDRVLLCSDGLHDMLQDPEIARLASGAPPKRATARLIAEANKRGGFDNVSVVLAQVGQDVASGGGWLANLTHVWATMTARQQRILIGLAALLAVVTIGISAWVGWSMVGEPDEGALTPTPTVTVTAPTEKIVPAAATQVSPATPTPVPAPQSSGAQSEVTPTATPEPTGTLRPTSTPSPTSEPPTPTYTYTPTSMPTPTAVSSAPKPGSGDPGSGSGSGSDSPPSQPQCTGPKPDCGSRGGTAQCENGQWVCK